MAMKARGPKRSLGSVLLMKTVNSVTLEVLQDQAITFVDLATHQLLAVGFVIVSWAAANVAQSSVSRAWNNLTIFDLKLEQGGWWKWVKNVGTQK